MLWPYPRAARGGSRQAAGARRLLDGRAVWTARAPGSACAPSDALGSATKLPVCWQAAALPSPHLTANSAEPCAIGPEAPGDRPSARSCTVVGKLCGSARWPRRAAKASVRRKDAADAVGDDHRSAARPGHASEAARHACSGCPITGAQLWAELAPHPCAAATVRRCAARCLRRATAVARRARTRADAVAQQYKSTDAAAAADTIGHGLVIWRDRQEGRELPRLQICVG